MCFVIYSIIVFVISVKSTSIKFELTVIYDYFQWLFFKLTVAKQQLQTQGKRATPYDHVKPRVQTVSGDQHHMYFSQIKFFLVDFFYLVENLLKIWSGLHVQMQLLHYQK